MEIQRAVNRRRSSRVATLLAASLVLLVSQASPAIAGHYRATAYPVPSYAGVAGWEWDSYGNVRVVVCDTYGDGYRAVATFYFSGSTQEPLHDADGANNGCAKRTPKISSLLYAKVCLRNGPTAEVSGSCGPITLIGDFRTSSHSI